MLSKLSAIFQIKKSRLSNTVEDIFDNTVGEIPCPGSYPSSNTAVTGRREKPVGGRLSPTGKNPNHLCCQMHFIKFCWVAFLSSPLSVRILSSPADKD